MKNVDRQTVSNATAYEVLKVDMTPFLQLYYATMQGSFKPNGSVTRAGWTQQSLLKLGYKYAKVVVPIIQVLSPF